MKKIGLLIFLPLILVSCYKEYTDSITFVNNSDIDVFVFGTKVIQGDSAVRYYRPSGGVVKSHSSDEEILMVHNKKWSSVFRFYGGSYNFFVLDAEVVEKYSWDSIRDNYVILKRYDFTEQDMIANDWTIVYP